ncbi:hypothetical protein CPB85DRAFT_601553 [Mucidula mucida]|nr:hypothetical protein CPB85DRAFT_601553 [Mucidula mucida]
MVTADWFATSCISWFHSHPNEVLRNIVAHINPAPSTSGDIFRPDEVLSATTQRKVDAAAERLVRWDKRPPDVVFRDGFEPRERPSLQSFPDAAFNLSNYVHNNAPSIFVSTRRYFRDKSKALRRKQNTHHLTYYEYEIFAYGGIDVNHVFGSHAMFERHEIAFPGGILPRFIRSVRVHRKDQPVEIVQNPRFSNSINPSGQIVALTKIPCPVITGKVVYYPPEDADAVGHGNDELSHRPRNDKTFNADKDWDNLMRGGATVADPLVKHALSRPCVAAVQHPTKPGLAYFFCWNMFVAIDIAKGPKQATIAWGPRTIIKDWPSLVQANFGYVDAVLLNPNNQQQMYFFFRKKCARIHIKSGQTDEHIIDKPKNISTEWPSLKKAGFHTVDAVLPHPSHKHKVCGFSGEWYVLIHYNFQPGGNQDYIVSGPTLITAQWPPLKEANFKTVDTILVHPTDVQKAYVFSGDQYVLIEMQQGTTPSLRISVGSKTNYA